MDRQTDQRMDKASHKNACLQLKAKLMNLIFKENNITHIKSNFEYKILGLQNKAFI